MTFSDSVSVESLKTSVLTALTQKTNFWKRILERVIITY